jgi:8-oxo-dGTP diphosphatase
MAIGRFLGGVGALLWDPDADNYLLLKRSDSKDFAPGAWECVTGRVDQGEGFEDAVHREVHEELGVRVRLLSILGTTHFYRGEREPGNELIGVVYLCSMIDAGPVRPGVEHSEFRWVSAVQARALLSADSPTESWLLNVIKRAELAKAQLSLDPAMIARQRGFELDS